MARKPRDVTDAELGVLQVLWAEAPSTTRQIMDRLYVDGSPSHYATVQKLLERLEAKGFVTRRARGRINEFEAVVDRDELIGRRLQATADTLCEGSLTPLLTHLVESASLSADELCNLRSLVERLDRSQDDGREEG
jgi:BlaI family transcriptional regulator, penicillinase repressor